MKRNRRTFYIILGLLLVLIILVLSFAGKRDDKEVTTELVERRMLTETVTASGKIQPESEVKIQSQVSGEIIELPVKEGDVVEKGQLLVRINPDIYTAALNRAEASLNGARSNLSSAKARLIQAEAQYVVQELSYNRLKKLFAEKAVSQAEMDNAQGTWETSKAEVTAAKESIHAAEFSIESAQASRNEASDNLRRTTIFAPMSGTVTALSKESGESVLGNSMMAGDIIMKVSAMDSMEVNVEVNESDIVRIQLGDTAIVEVDAHQDQKFSGVITEIGNTALNKTASGMMSMDQVTNFSVKVRILRESYGHMTEGMPATSSPFRPGMSATVEIITDRATDVLTVPIKAVATREDTSSASMVEKMRRKDGPDEAAPPAEPFTVVFVYVESDQTARLRVVRTGIQDDRYIAILDGISDGEKVITGPYEEVSRSLKSGDHVVERDELFVEN
jgi:HlyD family secretion protein